MFHQSVQCYCKVNDTIIEYNRFNHALGKKVATESHRRKVYRIPDVIETSVLSTTLRNKT
jgi:hypothetical protein